jgi:hypothetical protein
MGRGLNPSSRPASRNRDRGEIAKGLLQWHVPGLVASASLASVSPGLGCRNTALPIALQIADRFHLVYNLGNALKELLHSRRWHSAGTAREGPDASPERQLTLGKR